MPNELNKDMKYTRFTCKIDHFFSRPFRSLLHSNFPLQWIKGSSHFSGSSWWCHSEMEKYDQTRSFWYLPSFLTSKFSGFKELWHTHTRDPWKHTHRFPSQWDPPDPIVWERKLSRSTTLEVNCSTPGWKFKVSQWINEVEWTACQRFSDFFRFERPFLWPWIRLKLLVQQCNLV